MKKTRSLTVGCLLVFTCLLPMYAADAPEVHLVYKPGEKVTMVISFDHHLPKPLTGALFRFCLRNAAREDQKAFQITLLGTTVTRKSEAEYEISGIIDKGIATGEYQLDILNVSADSFTRSYTPPAIKIRVDNDQNFVFPDVSVKLQSSR